MNITMTTPQQQNILRQGYKVLAAYCMQNGISNGRFVDVAFSRPDRRTWRGIRVFPDRTAEVFMHNREKLIWWHEVVDILHGHSSKPKEIGHVYS